MISRSAYFILFLLISASISYGQSTATIDGTVVDNKSRPVQFANITVLEYQEFSTISDENGHFLLIMPAGETITLVFTFVGYEPVTKQYNLDPGQTLTINIKIKKSVIKIPELVIEEEGGRDKPSVITLDPEKVEQIPLPSNNFESLLKSIGLGVSTAGGELSSQYSVRGGNFDENLVYVNDFEIYRPQLIRSGQQEGLSFINPFMVRNVQFSSGGFEPKYGDKMSSVLDVQYRKPDRFRGVVDVSLLGASVSLEGASHNNRFRYLLGARHKSNQYLLSSLETQGEYQPSFTDLQGLLIYRLSPKWELEIIGNYARNLFNFVPENRISSIGTVNNVKQLEVFFEGQERDIFNNIMGGLSAVFATDSNRLRLKFLVSAYRSNETETFDIIGDYFLYQVESDLGEESFGERLFGLGFGTYQDFARNYLTSVVANLEHKGFFYKNNQFIEWGIKYQHEDVRDRLNEWERIDSAFFSLPYDPTEVRIWNVVKSENELSSNRLMGYLQDTWVLRDDSASINLTAGARAHYWDLNKEFLVSPRIQFSVKPNWKRNFIFKAAVGLYHQVPFYRELRNPQGEVNTDLKAQKSFHVVLGSDYVFDGWGGREFRFITEVYYKYMWDLVPYEVEDVKIRYLGENKAIGYAVGIDFRLNGEFVPGAESWISLSLLQTKENIDGDYYYDADSNYVQNGFIPRPTDQRVNISILFQDYLPKNENFKMHLMLMFGTGLPFSPPNSVQYRNALRAPSYRRVDIGFSVLLHDISKEKNAGFLNAFTSIWASLEVFNLLDIKNTISHRWVKDNTNTLYAFENHLTGRRLNLRLMAKF